MLTAAGVQVMSAVVLLGSGEPWVSCGHTGPLGANSGPNTPPTAGSVTRGAAELVMPGTSPPPGRPPVPGTVERSGRELSPGSSPSWGGLGSDPGPSTVGTVIEPSGAGLPAPATPGSTTATVTRPATGASARHGRATIDIGPPSGPHRWERPRVADHARGDGAGPGVGQPAGAARWVSRRAGAAGRR